MGKKSEREGFRVTAEGSRMLNLCALNLGVSKSSVVEMAIREFFEKRGYQFKPESTKGAADNAIQNKD